MADLDIREMSLRVTGLPEAEAEQLGRLVVEALAERLAGAGDRTLGVVDVRVAGGGLKGPALAARIADQLAGRLA